MLPLVRHTKHFLTLQCWLHYVCLTPEAQINENVIADAQGQVKLICSVQGRRRLPWCLSYTMEDFSGV